MAAKADFTSEEWSKLLESPMMVGMAISASEPSGLWGLLHEGFSGARQLTGSRDSETQLIKDIVADLATSEGRTIARDALQAQFKGAKPAEIVDRSVVTLREIAGILDRKAGGEAVAVKSWLYAHAERVANAASEGGFLGFGGQKVSENERATLKQISDALAI
ncbi:MAG: hypothetical protein R3D44_05650 [Hyphomicrobiaceae bacterium]